MISGVGSEAGFAGEKSDFSDEEGLARKASRSSEGLVVEESVLLQYTLAVRSGCGLLARTLLRQCLGTIAQIVFEDARCSAKCPLS